MGSREVEIVHEHLNRCAAENARLRAAQGDSVSVEALYAPAVLAEVGRILHVFGCVKDCREDPSAWEENARIILDAAVATALSREHHPGPVAAAITREQPSADRDQKGEQDV